MRIKMHVLTTYWQSGYHVALMVVSPLATRRRLWRNFDIDQLALRRWRTWEPTRYESRGFWLFRTCFVSSEDAQFSILDVWRGETMKYWSESVNYSGELFKQQPCVRRWRRLSCIYDNTTPFFFARVFLFSSRWRAFVFLSLKKLSHGHGNIAFRWHWLVLFCRECLLPVLLCFKPQFHHFAFLFQPLLQNSLIANIRQGVMNVPSRSACSYGEGNQITLECFSCSLPFISSAVD